MMDLDSAIQHCKEQVQEQAKKGCYSCAEEHQQLAAWLKDYKRLLEQEPKWISVSEKVPEDGEEVLCFLGSEEMAVLFRRNDWGQDEWVDGRFATESYDVIAWMPLPLPWKGESEAES